MPQNSSPEQEPVPRQQKRTEQFRHIIGSLISERELKIETKSTGFLVSLQEGLNVYLHAGNEEISTVQELNVMSPDTLLELSFEPHSFDDEPLGIVASSIYRIGKRGISISRKPKDAEATTASSEPASDTESLRLSAALGRLFYKKQK